MDYVSFIIVSCLLCINFILGFLLGLRIRDLEDTIFSAIKPKKIKLSDDSLAIKVSPILDEPTDKSPGGKIMKYPTAKQVREMKERENERIASTHREFVERKGGSFFFKHEQ